MQNEACIKQGSEKEPLRQQLNDAVQYLEALADARYIFDATEIEALKAVLSAAKNRTVAPKAFLRAVDAAEKLRDAKNAALSRGYTAEEYDHSEFASEFYGAVKEYLTARAVVLGFQKSLQPSGWDILEE